MGEVDRFDFWHELEFGITGRLQGRSLTRRLVLPGDQRQRRFHYQHSEAERRHYLTNPTSDFVGSGLSVEALVGDEFFELKGKLLPQKNVGHLIITSDSFIEAESHARISRNAPPYLKCPTK